MNYENIYFLSERGVVIFGRFPTKREAVKAAKEHGFSAPIPPECIRMATLNRKTGQFVFELSKPA